MPIADYTIDIVTDAPSTDNVSLSMPELTLEDTLEDTGVYRRKLTTEVVLSGADYDALKTVETSAGEFSNVTATIKKGGAELYSATLRFGSGQIRWDEDNKVVRFELDIEDQYQDFFDNWEDEFNMFDGTTTHVLNLEYGTRAVTLCENIQTPPFDRILTDCLEYPYSWTIRGYAVDEIEEQDGPTGEFRVGTTYERDETDTLPANSGDWLGANVTDFVLVDDSDITLVDDSDIVLTATNNPGGGTYARPLIYKRDTFEQSVFDESFKIIESFDNGVLLTDLLSTFIPSGYTLVSDFFDINADATAPSNDAYTAAAEYRDTLVFPVTDVTRYDATQNATQNATRHVWTYKEMLEHLQVIFNIEWRITGTTLRIEHVTYYEAEKVNGLDLTTGALAIYSRGRAQYTYNTDEVARKEKWEWMTPYKEPFESPLIRYPAATSEDAEEIARDATDINPDVQYCIEFPGNVGDEGFVFACAFEEAGEYYIKWKYRDSNQDEFVPNGFYMWSALIESFHQHKRLFLTGLQDGVETTYSSAIRRREQVPLPVAYDDADYFDSSAPYDPNNFVQTQYGWGEVKKAVYEVHRQLLTVTTIHD